MPIPVSMTSLILIASCPMRGASRGVTEVGQSESWPEGQPEGRCGARGHASQAWTRGALGNRPSPLRGSALNGWGVQVKGGRKPAWMASLLAPVPEESVPGPKKSPRWSVRKAHLGNGPRLISRIAEKQRHTATPLSVPSRRLLRPWDLTSERRREPKLAIQAGFPTFHLSRPATEGRAPY